MNDYNDDDWKYERHICPECGYAMERNVDVYEFWGRYEHVTFYECPHCGHCE